MRKLAQATAASAFLVTAAASAPALAGPRVGPSVAAPAVVEANAVRVCRTVTVRRHRSYYPFRSYLVKVKSCRWV
jgi:hypothetical protein